VIILDLDELKVKEVLLKYGIPSYNATSINSPDQTCHNQCNLLSQLKIGWTVDRSNRCYIFYATKLCRSSEKSPKTKPKGTIKKFIKPQLGISSSQAASTAKFLGYRGSQITELEHIIEKFVQAAIECDAELAEINPLVEINTGKFMATKARIVIDNNALFRHPEYQQQEAKRHSPQEALAEKYNLGYVKLDGNIGVIGNGAGLLMATIDLLHSLGGKPADFFDIGGGANAQTIRAALQILLVDTEINSILINVIGGMTRCDEIAQGILEATKETKTKKPVIVRLVGTCEKQGQRLLKPVGIEVVSSMEEAAKRAIELNLGAQQ
jgi:succinyl-CoA synthetase beta subunit